MSCSAGTCFITKPSLAPRKKPSAMLHGAPRRRRVAPVLSAPSGAVDHAEASCDACGPSCRACEPCRQKAAAAEPVQAPSGALVTVAMPLARAVPPPPPRAPRLALRPAGAIPLRGWDALNADERRALYGRALDRAMDASRVRPAGIPIPLEVLGQVSQADWDAMTNEERALAPFDLRSALDRMRARTRGRTATSDAMPEWAREAGITPQTWGSMNTTEREAARREALAASGQGWQTAQTVITQGTAIVNQILSGELQRDLARITAEGNANSARITADAMRFVAETNRQRGELELAAAQARAAGDADQAARFQQAIQAIQAAQEQAQGRHSSDLAALVAAMRERSGMSTGAMVAAGLGGVVLLGGIAYLATRRR